MTVTVTEFQRYLRLTAFRQWNLAFIAMFKQLWCLNGSNFRAFAKIIWALLQTPFVNIAHSLIAKMLKLTLTTDLFNSQDILLPQLFHFNICYQLLSTFFISFPPPSTFRRQTFWPLLGFRLCLTKSLSSWCFLLFESFWSLLLVFKKKKKKKECD